MDSERSLVRLQQIVDEILGAIDGKIIVAGLFLDLKKAFNTIVHVLLLKKLNTIGVSGVAVELLRNDLTNRLQTVCANSECGSFFLLVSECRKVVWLVLFYF
jgi:hypothetical protein